MKATIHLIFFSLLFSFCSAQNLVTNPSFEDYNNCPANFDQIYYATGWHGISSDYYNSCNSYSFSFGVPANGSGYQIAASGNAYAGLITYVPYNNYAELIQSELYTPLVIGQKYYVSIKASLADSLNCASSHLGVLFTTDTFGPFQLAPSYNHA